MDLKAITRTIQATQGDADHNDCHRVRGHETLWNSEAVYVNQGFYFR